ncbi:MAG TPA: preprotein translocase subunit SecG [Flavipsychrobacter sp.]|nr:preprotein translocase subunit SecG [Flavipsychrobacter sp.]
MIIIITVVIILVCAILAFFVLVQNPKGGGLTGAFGSIGSQVMGVKQSGDVMEKGTWTSMGIIAALCIICVIFYTTPKELQQAKQPAKSSAPASPAK